MWLGDVVWMSIASLPEWSKGVDSSSTNENCVGLNRIGNMIAYRDPGSNRGPSDLQSDALPTELSRLVTNPTHESFIVAQRRAGKETYDINAAGISQREQIASAEASAAEPLESQLGTSLAQPVKPKALTLAPPASAQVPYMSLCLVSCALCFFASVMLCPASAVAFVPDAWWRNGKQMDTLGFEPRAFRTRSG